MEPFVRRFRPKLWAYKVAAAEDEKRQEEADEALHLEEQAIRSQFRDEWRHEREK